MTTCTLPIAKAITAGLRDAMRADDSVLLMGEDIGVLGGVFRVTDGLHAEFGSQRVVDTPLAEAGIVGTAVGLALRGYRPVVEIQFDGFVFPAFNQITTQLAKMHNRTSGRVTMPVVVRIPHGGGIGAVEHHSESPEALFAHTAGLRILAPSNAQDAYWMTRQAIESDPLLGRIPAVEAGRMVVQTDEQQVLSISASSPLSLPWALENVVPDILAAAQQEQG